MKNKSTLHQLRTHFTIPRKLYSFLKNNGVETVLDIAQKGGLSRMGQLPEGTPLETIQLLNAHANLITISGNTELNHHLIEKGVDSIHAITRLGPTGLQSIMGGGFSAEELEDISIRARAASLLTSNYLLQRHQQGQSQAMQRRDGTPFSIDELDGQCTCEDCQSMVSPLAYLADLLDFTIRNVVENVAPDGEPEDLQFIDLPFLQDNFHQPFRDLPASCEAQKEMICQQRIATEILWKYADAPLTDSTFVAEYKHYLNTVYQTLLLQLGTSFDELRETHHGNEEDKKRLANRLGIALEKLPYMGLSPTYGMPTSRENLIENRFGYRSTRKSPLDETNPGGLYTWRKEHLREIWKQQDTVEDAYSRGEALKIDPDNIGIEDKTKPHIPALMGDVGKVWEKRRKAIDGWIEDFQGRTRNRGAYPLSKVVVIEEVDLSQHLNNEDVVTLYSDSTPEVDIQVHSVVLSNGESQVYLDDTFALMENPMLRFGLTKNFVNASGNQLDVEDEDIAAEILEVGQVEIGGVNYDVTSTSYNDGFTTIILGADLPTGTVEGSFSYVLNFAIQQRPTLHVASLFKMLMIGTFTYDNVYVAGDEVELSVWDISETISYLYQIWNELKNDNNTEAHVEYLNTQLKIEQDAFMRLMELAQINKQSFVHPDYILLSREEEEDILSIMVQCVKNTFFQTWKEEEETLSVSLDYYNFTIAPREPKEGFQPYFPSEEGTPCVEPDLITTNDLLHWKFNYPNYSNFQYGLYTNSIYRARVNQLITTRQNFQSAYNNPAKNLADVIDEYFIEYNLEGLETDLTSDDLGVVKETKRIISEELKLAEEDFHAMMSIRNKELTPSLFPSDSEVDFILDLLTQVKKKRQFYPQWLDQEESIPIWKLKRHTLPKWRGGIVKRTHWQQALKRRMEPPTIDPTILSGNDAIVTDTPNPAFVLLEARRQNMEDWLEAIGALTDINDKLEYGIGDNADAELLERLDALERSGENIKLLFQQFGLTYSPYRRLLKLTRLAVADPGQVTSDEWKEIDHILVKLIKQRKHWEWKQEEMEQGITLSPDYFRMTSATAGLTENKWLFDNRQRKQWERKLKARYEQDENVGTTLQNAIHETEEVSLKLMRDALIRYLANEEESLEDAAQRLSKLLLIDLQMNCCQKTTRISQATESLQTFIWSLRTHLLRDEFPNLYLRNIVPSTDDEIDFNESQFDEEWRWMGSYAMWRAAMFVFIYPQNLLLPTLRREQTPAFQRMVNQVRRNKRLTPKDACSAAREYSNYLRDVSNLIVAATATAETYIGMKDCGATNTLEDYGLLFFKFALNPDSKKMYWSASHPEPNYHKDTFWDEVPDVQSEVLEIFGASVYENEAFDVRGIYVFFKRMEKEERYLSFVKYNLSSNSFGAVVDLALPDDMNGDFHAVVKQSALTEFSPKLVIQNHPQWCFVRYLNSEGLDWEGDEWEVHSLDWYMIKALVGLGGEIGSKNEELMVAQGSGGDKKIYFRYFGELWADGRWYYMKEDIGFENLIQATYTSPTSSNAFVFYKGINSGLFDEPLKYLNYHGKALTEVEYKYNPGSDSKNMEEFIKVLRFCTGLKLDFDAHILLSDSDLTNNIFGTTSPQLSFEEVLVTVSNTELDSMIEKNKVWNMVELNLNILYNSSDSTYNALKYTDEYFEKHVPDDVNLKWAIRKLCGLMNFSQYNNFIINAQYDDLEISGGVLASSEVLELNIFNEIKDVNKIAARSGRLNSNITSYYCFHHRVVNNLGLGYYTNSKQLLTLASPPFYILQPIVEHPSTPINPAIYGGWQFLNQSFRLAPKQGSNPFRKEVTEKNYNHNYLNPGDYAFPHQTNLEYIKEAYYYVPLYLAMQLCERGHYVEALDWIRIIYDYTQAEGERKIYYGLIAEESVVFDDFIRLENWLQDPLDIHIIASNRPGAYTEYTKMALMRCLLAYADAEYTLDTVESVAKAKLLYEQVLELCDGLPKGESPCENISGQLDVKVGDDYIIQVWQDLVIEIGTVGTSTGGGFGYQNLISDVNKLMRTSVRLPEKLSSVRKRLDEFKATIAKPTINSKLKTAGEIRSRVAAQLIGQPAIQQMLETTASRLMQRSTNTVATERDTTLSGVRLIRGIGQYIDVHVPAPIFSFCIPVNPYPRNLCFQAALNLYKIRNCMNIAGVVRELEPYSAPTDTVSGMPQIGGGGNLLLPGTVNIQPTQYRYPVLIERAKQLVSIAQNVESAFLSALEKRDAEYYNLMKAKQDLALSKAGIRLQDLRIKEAEGSVKLAELQRDRTQLQVNGLQEMIAAGLNEYEVKMIDGYYEIQKAKILAQIMGGISRRINLMINALSGAYGTQMATIPLAGIGMYVEDIASGANVKAILAETQVQINSLFASFERRKQEWQFQKSLSEHDIKIGDQQINIAEQHVRVVGQEKVIAEMQSEFAQETVDFLTNKFTNVELYDWMSGVLENVYSYFLQQATSMAHLAANQLAFERQEIPPTIIGTDYWAAPLDNAVVGTIGGNEVDRRGLTGSARLLQDIYQLDQYAFETNKRKLQLTKTISLASISPIEFQQFKETGVMTFHLPMRLFDRDFPGHYLRLINKVRTSVIALIPPVEGIKATLTNTGITRVVIGGTMYQVVIMRRQPEVVALTSPQEATGMFELQTQSEFLNPFEGLGVDSFWEFRMEKAGNQFDFSTIADVLITLEYTALNSFDYARQIRNKLNSDRFVSAMRPFSMKNEFADQWYDLHHPIIEDGVAPQTSVKFKTTRADFPPNISELGIKAVSMYAVLSSEVPEDAEIKIESFTIQGGTITVFSDSTVNRLISTQTHNTSWSSDTPVEQEWEMVINDAATLQLFENEMVEEILFVVTYEGERAKWL